MTANARIVERLRTMADQVERGMVSITEVRDSLLGHTEAVERVSYSMVKEAQLVWGQLTRAINDGREDDLDVLSLCSWLRAWAAQVPIGPA